MNWEEGPLSWINLRDEAQCGWAIRYLEKKGIVLHGYGDSPAQSIRRVAQELHKVRDREILVRRMQGAWTSYKHSHTNSRCSRSFTLPSGVWKMLSSLAKKDGVSQTRALQDLIEAAFNNETFESRKLREAKKRAADPVVLASKKRTHKQRENKELAELRRFREAIFQLADHSKIIDGNDQAGLLKSQVPALAKPEHSLSRASDEQFTPAEMRVGESADTRSNSEAPRPNYLRHQNELSGKNARGLGVESFSGSTSDTVGSEAIQKAGHEDYKHSDSRKSVYGSVRRTVYGGKDD